MLDVSDVVVRFDGRAVLDAVSLHVGTGEIVALLGPSGCGKSTLLRVIAGLHMPDRGRVAWNGEDLAGVPPHRRGIGLVFQDLQLFPHKDVGANVAFGLRMQGVESHERKERVAALLDMVGLPGYEHRRTSTLSGGEAQRVALARSLAPEPRLLLLDEPLGALDRDLHDRLAVDVRALLRRVGITAIHVTHDEDEARTIGDRLVVLGRRTP
ncbi:MAG TPA: ABC transporter ATP-binding protein [Acidimicrobiales bacterium]|jgi:thiamine transport system ATP-binding protein